MERVFTNISWYRFTSIDDAPELRAPLLDMCLSLGLRGTILLSEEGMNLNLCGSEQAIEDIIAHLEQDDRFSGMDVKRSHSERQTFSRMLVKVKREIITLRRPEIRPEIFTGPSITSELLVRWYEQGRDFTMLDARNRFEVRMGRFEDALDLDITSFEDFPEAIATLDPELRTKPLVVYCTGGIRCEKASPVLLDAGFEQVYQLKGGILSHFEHRGGSHWQGECFVFDARVALDPRLEETDTVQCFACREPVNAQEQRSADYTDGESCPRCAC